MTREGERGMGNGEWEMTGMVRYEKRWERTPGRSATVRRRTRYRIRTVYFHVRMENGPGRRTFRHASTCSPKPLSLDGRAHMSHGMRNELPENDFLPIGMSNSGILLPLRMPRMEGRIRAGILLNRISCFPFTWALSLCANGQSPACAKGCHRQTPTKQHDTKSAEYPSTSTTRNGPETLGE